MTRRGSKPRKSGPNASSGTRRTRRGKEATGESGARRPTKAGVSASATKRKKRPSNKQQGGSQGKSTGGNRPRAKSRHRRSEETGHNQDKSTRTAPTTSRARSERATSASVTPLKPSPVPENLEPDDASELGIGSRVVPPAIGHMFDDDDLDEAVEESDVEEEPSRPHSDLEMQDEIRQLEARLDGLIQQASEFSSEGDDESSAEFDSELERIDRNGDGKATEATPNETELSGLEATRELLSSDYYRRQWGRLGMRNRLEQVDEFGLDPAYEKKFLPFLNLLFERYFRCDTEGIDNVPATGRCLVVANHGGTLPLDGLMLRSALRLRHESARELRWLAEDFVFYLPFVGVIMNRLGAVRACQENAERLLHADALVAAFPEGTKGVKKLYRDRYRLQRFGRGGYIRLCLRTGAPLVPCAIVGAEDMNPLLYRLEQVPPLFGQRYFPITPTFPLLGPAGLLPAPSKWKMVFGPALDLSQYGPEDANDHVLVGRLSEQVQTTISEMLKRTLGDRQSVWFG